MNTANRTIIADPQVTESLAPTRGARNRSREYAPVSEYWQFASVALRWLAGFALLWILFYGMFRAFPYIAPGADLVYRAKLQYAEDGEVFPAGLRATRVLIFGDSRVLSGFIPDDFDGLASGDGRKVYSFNSGYPARSNFVPQLKTMAARGQTPDVLLLTLPWQPGKAGVDPFNVVTNDHDLAETLFPFRYIVRDLMSFLLTSRNHGGPVQFYSTSRHIVERMRNDRGYYFIFEGSRFSGDRLPDDFHLDTDQPNVVDTARKPVSTDSIELGELNQIVTQHHILCYYVPYYLREGAAAAPPPYDREFAEFIDKQLPCTVVGPRYFLYPPKFFSDPVHLNRGGAQVYTEQVYRVLAAQLAGRQ
jgi:hypothetical protein